MFTDFKGNLIKELVLRNSWEILLNASPEILEKFLGLGHQVYRFLGELNKKISFDKFLGITL